VVKLVTSTFVVGSVTPENVEHQVEVILKPSKVDGVSELNRALRTLVNPVDGVVDLHVGGRVSEVELVTVNLDCAIVRVHDGVRILLFDDGGEVEDLTLVHSVSRAEDERSRAVVVLEELGVLIFLSFHSLEVDFRLVVTIRILYWGKLVGVSIVQVESESSCHLGSEIGMSVGEDINVQVELKKAVKTIAVTNDRALDTDSVFCVSLNTD